MDTAQSKELTVVETNYLYGLADVMGATLFQSALYRDEWTGCAPVTTVLGPWSVAVSNVAWSDEVSSKGGSMFLKMKGDLWGYVISDPKSLRMVLFDGKSAGITRTNAATFGSRTISKTLDDILPYVAAFFVHRPTGWIEVKEEAF